MVLGPGAVSGVQLRVRSFQPVLRSVERGAAVDALTQVARELVESLLVDLALEVDNRLHRYPVVAPAPRVELRLLARAQAHVAVATHQAQQKPDLLLPAIVAAPVALDPLVGNVVAQPVAGAAEDA